MTAQRLPRRDAAIARHRGGWPTPGAGRPAAIGLTVAALVLSSITVTTLAVAATSATAPAAPAWYDGCAAPCLNGPRDRTASLAGQLTGPPTRVRIPRIGVDSSLVGLDLDRAGHLAAPSDYGQAGWFQQGTVPGDTGPAVIAGHVDSKAGPAVFYRLHELRPGDRVEVLRGRRWVPFVVVTNRRHTKDAFPTAEVYGPTPRPELRLITCGGQFDTAAGAYRDNVVVSAIADLPAVVPSSAAG